MDGGETITSASRLAEVMGGVKTPEAAIAFLYAVQCDLIPAVGEHRQQARQEDGNWRVWVIRRPMSGSSKHPSSRVEFSLEPTGRYKEVTAVVVDPGDVESCGD